MENVNTIATAAQRQQKDQEHQQHSSQLHSEHLQHHQQQQQQQQQPQHHENQQQFCLRWHNHQTSLLSTLPVLLDQSHLTDVTISAEGRTLRAHRVVLSACSGFFLELFRALDASNHPVIILPGASFAAIVALLTFMYSGEVNVYEEQIPVLLNLAETLGVKGLADVQNNKSTPKSYSMEGSCEQPRKTEDIVDAQSYSVPPRVRSPTPTPPPPPPAPASAPPLTTFSAPIQPQSQQVQNMPAPLHPFTNPMLVGKLPTQLENFFLKSLQFYPNFLQQPLNFSQTTLNKTTELLAKYQQHCNLYQGAFSTLAGSPKETLASLGDRFSAASPTRMHEDTTAFKRFCASEQTQGCGMFQQQQQLTQHPQKDAKRIDKIADNLRFGSNGSGTASTTSLQLPHNLQATMPTSSYAAVTTNASCNYAQMISPQFSPTKPPPNFATATASAMRNQSPQQQQQHNTTPNSPASTASTSLFEATNIEGSNASARSLHHQIEQFAGCNRPSDIDDITMAAPNSKGFDSNNQQNSPSLSVAAEKFHVTNKTATTLAMSNSPGANAAQGKTPSNSKLYATCFICHKQLSNQYNLRVHLETHQNVRYACNVCSHVSRSKDALRKHVSYRHPGAPSPCETEARRKRASKVLLSGGGSSSITCAVSNMPATSPPTPAIGDSGNSSASSNGSEAQIAAAAAHLNSAAAYMFLPNQFHLAAAAAAVVQQQQQQQQHQQQQQQQQHVQKTSPQSFSAAISPLALEIDATQAAATPIKLEQHSPSSSEATSSSPLNTQQQQTKSSSSDTTSSNNREHLIGLQRSSPI